MLNCPRQLVYRSQRTAKVGFYVRTATRSALLLSLAAVPQGYCNARLSKVDGSFLEDRDMRASHHKSDFGRSCHNRELFSLTTL
jgi:hypothetical protein